MGKQRTKIAVITSAGSWYNAHVATLVSALQTRLYEVLSLADHRDLESRTDIVFLLSYFSLVEQSFLDERKFNIVVHASNLPYGKGWAPFFWQVIEGRKTVPFSMFNADSGVDSGDIIMTRDLTLSGTELHDELREKEAQHIHTMVLDFMDRYESDAVTLTPQQGCSTTYPRRTPADSELDVDKTIAEQFDLLRTVNNCEFPAFFRYRGNRYTIRITKDDRGEDENC